MGFFSRKKGDTIDFVELAKRGVLGAAPERKEFSVGSDGLVDFTARGVPSASLALPTHLRLEA